MNCQGRVMRPFFLGMYIVCTEDCFIIANNYRTPMNRLILLIFSFLLGSLSYSQYEDENSFGAEPPRPDEVVENFNENGTYEKYENGKLVASGFHVNGKFDGELTNYYRGSVIEITEYQLGKKYGKSVIKHESEYDFSRYSRYDEICFYENDKIIGYKYHISGNDTIYKVGPFNEKVKKENKLVLWSKSSYDDEYSHGLETISEVTYLFKNDVFVEKTLRYYLVKNDELKQVNHLSETYQMDDLVFRYSDVKDDRILYSVNPGKRLNIKGYDNSGELSFIDAGDSTTYFYKETGHTNVYYEAKSGNVKFRSVNDKGITVCESILKEDGKTFLLSFYTEKKGELLYTVTSKDQQNITIEFAADSLKQYYQKGEFTGVDGVKYLFDSTGNITTSKTKEELLFEWKTPLSGSYVSITDIGSSFKEYTQYDFSAVGATITKKRVQYTNESITERIMSKQEAEVFQKDSLLYLIYSEKAKDEYDFEKFVSEKLCIRNNQPYKVFPVLNPLNDYSKVSFFPCIATDAVDPISLPFISLSEFNPKQEYRKIESASKAELEELFKELNVHYQRFLALHQSVKYDFAQQYFQYNSDSFRKAFFLSKGYELKGGRSSFEIYLTNLGFKEEEVKQYMALMNFKDLKAI